MIVEVCGIMFKTNFLGNSIDDLASVVFCECHIPELMAIYFCGFYVPLALVKLLALGVLLKIVK